MTDYSPEFEEFWKAYPKRHGEKRGKSPAYKKVWVKMSAAERHVAQVDVDKRNRQRGWGKYITDAERYLKNKGWDDEWEPYVPDDDVRPNSGPYVPPIREPEIVVPWEEQLLARLFRNYVMMAGGLPDVQFALDEKAVVMREVVPVFREEVEAKSMDRRAASLDIARNYLHRLDIAYGKTVGDRVWKATTREPRWLTT